MLAQLITSRALLVTAMSANQARAVCTASPGAKGVHLVGIGGVGRTLVEQLLAYQERSAGSNSCAASIAMRSVADSSGAVVALGGGAGSGGGALDSALLRRILAYKEQDPTARLSSFALGGAASSAMLMPAAALPFAAADAAASIVVDCSASSAAPHLEKLRAARRQGAAVVLANKKPLADGSFGDFAALRDSGGGARGLRYEATVGAGLPIIGTLQRQQLAGDCVRSITLMGSGTLGIVFDQLQPVVTGGDAQKPPLFSEVVREALANGYTEPDPRDDLSGTDVARKALILARSAASIGGSDGSDSDGGGGGIAALSLDGVGADALFPPEMASRSMSVESFLREGLPQLDAAMAARAEAAAARGEVSEFAVLPKLPTHTRARTAASPHLRPNYHTHTLPRSRCFATSPL